ncbi:hypothetical protein LWI28_027136 [Acer negundo]|uniref:Uncharacterized protein n=1 Tax=Acer negundo TaxID=4023 RepID=A0AAD5IAY1_ACENE|nr:hypothetical protein LWI28_027136 [Acer negundo]
MLDSLSLNSDESAQNRDLKLKEIGFVIDLNEKRRNLFRLLQPMKQPKEEPVDERLFILCLFSEVVHEPFVHLTKEEEYEVECISVASNWYDIVFFASFLVGVGATI